MAESHARHPSQPVWALVKSLPALREHLAALTAELKGLRADLAAARLAAAEDCAHCSTCGHHPHYGTCGLVCDGVPCDCHQEIQPSAEVAEEPF